MTAIWMLLFSYSCIGSVVCTIVSEYWRIDSDTTWQTTTGTVVFTTQVQRPLDCASLCSSVSGCLVFGFSAITGTCQGYSRLQTPMGSSSLSVLGSTEIIYKNIQSCARAGFDFIQEGHMCVKIFTDNVDWEDAKALCETIYGRLAVIDTRQKLDVFAEYLDSMGYDSKSLWIGLTDTANEGTWVWLNGNGLDQSYWDDVILNDFCVDHLFAFSADCGRMHYRDLSDDHCDKTQAYVCERHDII